MSRCRASCVSSRVLVGRAIDLLVPWLAAMVPLAPNAATASLEAARTSSRTGRYRLRVLPRIDADEEPGSWP